MRISVLFFATLREKAGTKSLALELSTGATVADLKIRIVQEVPTLAAVLKSVLVAVNCEYTTDEQIIPAGAEIALFPPVSGG